MKGRDNEPSCRVVGCHFPGRISNSTSRCNSTSSSNRVYIVTFTCESAHPAFPLSSKNTWPKAIALGRPERRSSDGGRTGRSLHPTKHQNFGQARGPEVSGVDDGPDHACRQRHSRKTRLSLSQSHSTPRSPLPGTELRGRLRL